MVLIKPSSLLVVCVSQTIKTKVCSVDLLKHFVDLEFINLIKIMNDIKQMKRIKVQLKRPNPLFETWLDEWLQESRESNSKLQYCYSKALSALRKYPLPLTSGTDCRILEGFGQKLCLMLNRKLLLHKESLHDLPTLTSPKRSKVRRSAVYCPELNSGPYALMIALYKETMNVHFKGFLFKTELVKLAQPLSEKSFTKCDPGSYYTAWSSMKTLLEKELVVNRGSPAKYSLTAEGVELGIKLYENHLKESCTDEKNVAITKNDFNILKCSFATSNDFQKDYIGISYDVAPTIRSQYPISHLRNDVNTVLAPSCSYANTKIQKPKETLPKSNSMTSTSTNTILDEFSFAPKSFEVILIVDTNETNGSANFSKDPLLSDLTFKNVKFEVRNLKVGDFTWIARNETTNKELVLPYIIERKRADDFACSIKDGRFHEQKFRLKQSGIQNLIYLVESHGNNQHTGLPISTLLQASVNTLVQDQFQMKYTDNLRETVNYLTLMTRIIKELFQEKTLMSCLKEDLVQCTPIDTLVPLMTFIDFNKAAAKNKNLKIRQLFVRQLLQLKGLSLDKALAIVDTYPTPLDLHLAYKTCISKQGELLLSNIKYGDQKKPIGAIISKTIFLFCTALKYN